MSCGVMSFNSWSCYRIPFHSLDSHLFTLFLLLWVLLTFVMCLVSVGIVFTEFRVALFHHICTYICISYHPLEPLLLFLWSSRVLVEVSDFLCASFYVTLKSPITLIWLLCFLSKVPLHPGLQHYIITDLSLHRTVLLNHLENHCIPASDEITI